MIDVGQGDSTLINLSNNMGSLLIDTGGKTTYQEEWIKKNNNYSLGKDGICLYLKSEGIKRLKYLILTHGDYDHLGEAINVLECINTEIVIFNSYNISENESFIISYLNRKKIRYYFYKENDFININKYSFKFISPSKNYNNENDNSLVIYTELNNFKLLFMGDAGVKREKEIIDKYNLGNIDFLKVGHHGSDTSSSKYFISTINPKNSFISVGTNNKFGHPKDSVLETLKNVNIYRTDLNGSVKLKLNKYEYKIELKNKDY